MMIKVHAATGCVYGATISSPRRSERAKRASYGGFMAERVLFIGAVRNPQWHWIPKFGKIWIPILFEAVWDIGTSHMPKQYLNRCINISYSPPKKHILQMVSLDCIAPRYWSQEIFLKTSCFSVCSGSSDGVICSVYICFCFPYRSYRFFFHWCLFLIYSFPQDSSVVLMLSFIYVMLFLRK